MQEELAQAYDAGIARGIWTPTWFNDWWTPVVPVRKAAQTSNKPALHVCGDYSATVNPQLETYRHPLPLPEELMRRLGGCGFTQIDLADAYKQVRLGTTSRERLALSTHRGVLLQNVLPFGISSTTWLFPASNGRNHQWSAQCSHLSGRHSLQWCNSGSTFTESAPVTRKASWQRTAMPSWEMHLRPATGGLFGARAVQRRNSQRSTGQCPQPDASAAWRVHTTFVSWLRPILRQAFATHVCSSGRTAILSYQERSMVGMGDRRGSSVSSAEAALICSRCARSFWSIPSIRSCLRCISGRDWHYLVSLQFWRKWTTNSQHFQDAHRKSAQLQPDTKRSVGHHLCLEEILP